MLLMLVLLMSVAVIVWCFINDIKAYKLTPPPLWAGEPKKDELSPYDQLVRLHGLASPVTKSFINDRVGLYRETYKLDDDLMGDIILKEVKGIEIQMESESIKSEGGGDILAVTFFEATKGRRNPISTVYYPSSENL